MHSYDTIHQLIFPSSSQQNGRAERKLRHIFDNIRAFLLFAKVPAPFWGEIALYAINHIPVLSSTIIQNQTPYECLFGSPPDYHHLLSLNSTYFVLLQSHEYNKLESQSRLFYFIGYGKTQKGHRCYDFVSHHLRISCNIVFWEHCSFVELSHFRASLSISFVLDLFLDELHIPSIAAPNLPIDFFVPPSNIFYAFLGSPFNEHVEDE